jgi:hypothetical protein
MRLLFPSSDAHCRSWAPTLRDLFHWMWLIGKSWAGAWYNPPDSGHGTATALQPESEGSRWRFVSVSPERPAGLAPL